MQAIGADFREHVYRAAGRSAVRQAVERIYADLQAQIDLRRPRCDASGRCCRFEEFGHRLFVTTMELATFIYDLELGNRTPEVDRLLLPATAPAALALAAATLLGLVALVGLAAVAHRRTSAPSVIVRSLMCRPR